MCNYQELKDSNEKEHNEINTSLKLLNKDVKSISSANTMWKTLLGLAVVLILFFSGAGANYQRLTYEHEIATIKTLDEIQDTVNSHWNKSREAYNNVLIPHMISAQAIVDCTLMPTQARSISNEIVSTENRRILLQNGLIP